MSEERELSETMSSVVAWIGAVVASHPGDAAVVEDGRTWTYHDLWERSGAVAHDLLGSGVTPGRAVGIVGDNEAAYVSTYLGILRAGATAVPVNSTLDATSVGDQLRLAGVGAVFVGRVAASVRDELAATFTVLPITATPRAAARRRLPPIGAETTCTILLTSGSTGRPKGVVHTHGSMLHGVLQVAAAFPFGRRERGVVFLPLYACLPELVLPMLCSGGTVEVLPGFDVERVADACTRATMFDAVPTIMSRLVEHAPLHQLAGLRWIMYASEPMPTPLLRRWWDELPGVETHQLYGMTEVLPLTAASHGMLQREPSTVGRAFSTAGLWIEPRPDAPDTDDGELVCTSPARMREYHLDPAATAAAMVPGGGMRTGDLARIDDDGLVFLTGRSKDVIISGGLNISPAEIEAVASAHPAVEAAIVIGVPSARWGETPVVVAVARQHSAVTAADVLAHCRASLSSYKRPSAAALVPSLPTTGIGKAAKVAVRRMIDDGEIVLVHADGRPTGTARPPSQPDDGPTKEAADTWTL